MRTTYLSAGHSNTPGRDRGAVSGSYIEGDLAVEARQGILKELKLEGVPVIADSNNSILSETLAFFRNIVNDEALVIDLHFNASANPLARGVECIVPNSPTKVELALGSAISLAISQVLNSPLRGSFKGSSGVKSESDTHRGKLGWMGLKGANVLVEICFISSATDMNAYNLYKPLVWKAIAKAISIQAKTSTIDTNPTYYGVKKGDTLWSISVKYGVSIDKLIALNPGLSVNSLRVGYSLRLS